MNSRIILLYTCICFLLLIGNGCKNNSETLRLLNLAEELMNARPDSTLIILRNLENKISKQQVRAKHSLLYSQALDKNAIDIASDSIIAPAVKYYSTKGPLNDRAKTYFYLGRIYENASNPNDAMDAFMVAKDYASKASDPDNNLIGLISATLGMIYLSQEEFKSAIDCYNTAITHYQKADNETNIMLSYEDLSYAQRMAREYEAALLSNLQAIKISTHLCDTLSLVRQLGAKADIHFYYSNYHKALDILSQRDNEFPRWIKYNHMWGLYAKIYNKIDNLGQAWECAQKLYISSKLPEKQMGALLLLSQIEKEAGNYKEALHYKEKAYFISDSLRNADKSNQLKTVEQKYNSLVLQNKVTALKNHNLALLLTICILIILLIFSGYVIKQNITKKREVLESKLSAIDDLMQKCQKLEQENEAMFRSQSVQNDIILMHKERISDTIRVLNRIFEITENTKKDIKSHISLYIKRDKNNYSDLLDTVRNIIDISAPGILNYLVKKHPELTDSEIDLYCISCLDLSKATMCVLLNNSSIQYIYNRKSTLKKSLGITDSNVSLKSHLSNLIDEFLGEQKENE